MNVWLKKFREFAKEIVKELKICTWPTRKELIQTTINTIIIVVGLSAFVACIDFGSQKVIKILIGV